MYLISKRLLPLLVQTTLLNIVYRVLKEQQYLIILLARFRLARAAAMNLSKIRVQRDNSCYSYSEPSKIAHARYTCLCLERLREDCVL